MFSVKKWKNLGSCVDSVRHRRTYQQNYDHFIHLVQFKGQHLPSAVSDPPCSHCIVNVGTCHPVGDASDLGLQMHGFNPKLATQRLCDLGLANSPE